MPQNHCKKGSIDDLNPKNATTLLTHYMNPKSRFKSHACTYVNHLCFSLSLLSTNISMYISLYLSISLSVYAYLSISLSVYLSISQFFYLSTSPYVIRQKQTLLFLISSFRGKSCLILRKRPFVSSKSLAIDKKELESKEEILKEERRRPRSTRRRRWRPTGPLREEKNAFLNIFISKVFAKKNGNRLIPSDSTQKYR